MMAKFVLIGGGDVGRGNSNYETKEIDEEVVSMTEKENPNFLFIGLASHFSDSYYDTIKKIYQNLGCHCNYLKKKNILHNPDIVKKKIEDADIIYFCGGDTVKLIHDVKEYDIVPLLEEAMKRTTVFVGMSAGAILLCEGGFSDSLLLRGESDKHEFLTGLSFVNLNICPHYHSNSKKTEELSDFLKNNRELEVYCMENCTALKVIDEKIEVIKSDKNRNVYLSHYKDQYIEKMLENR